MHALLLMLAMAAAQTAAAGPDPSTGSGSPRAASRDERAGVTVPKQAVVETSAGTFVIDLAPDEAPNTTAYFMKVAADGGYDGTTFHRMVKYGLVQGGDPLSKDPAKRAAAIVKAVTHFKNPEILAEVSKSLGEPMKGLEISKIGKENLLQYRGN